MAVFLNVAKTFCSTLCIALLLGCHNNTSAPQAQAPVEVQTVTVQAHTEPHWIALVGQIEASNAISIMPEVSGKITQQFFSDGQYVSANEPLFQIDRKPYYAKFLSAQSAYRKAMAALELADAQLKRGQSLYKNKIISIQELEILQSTYSQALQSKEDAYGTLLSAQNDLDNTTVKAPIDGYITRAELNVGTLVNSANTLTSIVPLNKIIVSFSASDRALMGQTITQGRQIRIQTDQGQMLSGQVYYVAPNLDPNNASRRMQAHLQDATTVTPGQIVHVQLHLFDDHNAFRVPQKAVIQKPDGTYGVYVVNTQNKATFKPVTVGFWEGTDWVIRTGLQNNDRVITNQLLKLKDGTSVQIAPSTRQSTTSEEALQHPEKSLPITATPSTEGQANLKSASDDLDKDQKSTEDEQQ